MSDEPQFIERRRGMANNALSLPISTVYVIIVTVLGSATGASWYMAALNSQVQRHEERLKFVDEDRERLKKEVAASLDPMKRDMAAALDALRKDMAERRTLSDENLRLLQQLVEGINLRLTRMEAQLTYLGNQVPPASQTYMPPSRR